MAMAGVAQGKQSGAMVKGESGFLSWSRRILL
jgi:hypothetical protein